MNTIFKIYFLFVLLYLFHANSDETVGRIAELDEMINEPYVLKAIAFSARSKDLIYQQILDDLIYRIESNKFKYKYEIFKNYECYVYILKNVRKFTSKWLTEEINILIDKSYAKLDKKDLISKKNIANYIYHCASEYAIYLVINGMDTSLTGWKSKLNLKKEEL